MKKRPQGLRRRGNRNGNAPAKRDRPNSGVKEEIRRALKRFFNKALDRRPVILPVIIEI